MSGGSYNYLHIKAECGLLTEAPGFTDLVEMRARLAEIEVLADIGDQLGALIDRARDLDDDIRRYADLLQAVEWYDSADWSLDQVLAAAEQHRAIGRPQA